MNPRPGHDPSEGLGLEELLAEAERDEAPTPPPVAPIQRIELEVCAETPFSHVVGLLESGAIETVVTPSASPIMNVTFTTRGALAGSRTGKPQMAFILLGALGGAATVMLTPSHTPPRAVADTGGGGDSSDSDVFPDCHIAPPNEAGDMVATGTDCWFTFPSAPDSAVTLTGKAEANVNKMGKMTLVDGSLEVTMRSTHPAAPGEASEVEVFDCDAPIVIQALARVPDWKERVALANKKGEKLPYDFSTEITKATTSADGSRNNHTVQVRANLSRIRIFQKGDPKRGIKDREIFLNPGEETDVPLDFPVAFGCAIVSENKLGQDNQNPAKYFGEGVVVIVVARRATGKRENKKKKKK